MADSAAKDGRARSNSGMSVDYVRDGALAAHRKMSGSLLNKLGLGSHGHPNGNPHSPRGSPEPPLPPAAAAVASLATAAANARSATTTSSSSGSLPITAGTTAAASSGTSGSSTSGGHDPAYAASLAAQHAEAASKIAMSSNPKRAGVPLPAAIVTATTRARKGSLRKNILQRGSLQRMETILSPRAVSVMSDATDSSGSVVSVSSPDTFYLDDDYPTPRGSLDKGSREYGLSQGGSQQGNLDQTGLHLDRGLASASIPLSRSNALKDNSTTDEDEKPPGSSSSNASSELMIVTNVSGSAPDSYFTPQAAFPNLRRRSPNKSSKTTKSSPLSAVPLDAASAAQLSSEGWDYQETEWWGWIILFVTWVTFVVGMGSCFGAWSWAWDVGETPYAPPELEDDPTLPIVGYYPALIVLTGVMAWVWVIIAWVGMKYFKHAKIHEDG